VGDVTASAPAGFAVPSEAELLAAVREGIKAAKPLFADPAVTEFVTVVKEVKKKADEQAEAAGA
jgi:hypothetical protein